METPQKLRDYTGEIGALILCGGLGTRLRSVMADRPKSMAPVADVPFLQLLVEELRSKGFRKVTLATGHMAELIESYFADGAACGVPITYSPESKPLGTGGAVKNAESQLSDPIFILNGDSYTEWNLKGMQERMNSTDADLVIALQKVADVSRYGSVKVDSNLRVVQFQEKGSHTGAGLINAGVYLLRKKIIQELPADVPISLEKDIFPHLLKGKVYGLISEGSFIDIGVPDDYHLAQSLLAPQARAAAGTVGGFKAPKELASKSRKSS